MKIFNCQSCRQLIFFENVQCIRCKHTLGYLPDVGVLSALEPSGEGRWRALAPEAGDRLYKMCRNYSEEAVCNWMLDASDSASLCLACRHNRTIPDLSVPENRAYWQRLETAKRRLIYGLMNLGLPLLCKREDPERGLAFAFMGGPDPQFRESNAVMTGHANGLITINVAEADDVVREKMRLQMHEVYRTVLGHFRHEIGHYYWELLVRPSDQLEPFRELFGDERSDYDKALQKHYSEGPPADWPEHFVSAYASSHPWEDWAETWAQYLHIVDTLETARSFSLQVKTPEGAAGESMATPGGADAYQPPSFKAMMESWLPLAYAINNINRSMGQPDMYPFVLAPKAVQKMAFVHQVISCSAQQERQLPPAKAASAS
jgi:hypothetical protein